MCFCKASRHVDRVREALGQADLLANAGRLLRVPEALVALAAQVRRGHVRARLREVVGGVLVGLAARGVGVVAVPLAPLGTLEVLRGLRRHGQVAAAGVLVTLYHIISNYIYIYIYI